MMNLNLTNKRTRRQTKRLINRLLRKAGYGKYVIDCRYHPCIVTGVVFYKDDPYGCGCLVKSLFNDKPSSCSYLHCGIEPINKTLADEMVEFRKTHSFDEYLIKFLGFTQEALDEFELEFR